jgi:hypothetical protein
MSKLENRHVIFLGSLYDRAKVIEQLSLVMVLPRQFVESLTLVFPYYGFFISLSSLSIALRPFPFFSQW